jgi:hypothetical protein
MPKNSNNSIEILINVYAQKIRDLKKQNIYGGDYVDTSQDEKFLKTLINLCHVV